MSGLISTAAYAQWASTARDAFTQRPTACDCRAAAQTAATTYGADAATKCRQHQHLPSHVRRAGYVKHSSTSIWAHFQRLSTAFNQLFHFQPLFPLLSSTGCLTARRLLKRYITCTSTTPNRRRVSRALSCSRGGVRDAQAALAAWTRQRRQTVAEVARHLVMTQLLNDLACAVHGAINRRNGASQVIDTPRSCQLSFGMTRVPPSRPTMWMPSPMIQQASSSPARVERVCSCPLMPLGSQQSKHLTIDLTCQVNQGALTNFSSRWCMSTPKGAVPWRTPRVQTRFAAARVPPLHVM
jgi:hypothetical protein